MKKNKQKLIIKTINKNKKMKQFIKKEELTLLNGGYLSNTAGNPVFNKEFVELQNKAHYIVTFSELAKTKDFTEKKADSLEDLVLETKALIDNSKKITFVDYPTKIKMPTKDKLTSEALNFIAYQGETSKVKKLNDFLQKFSLLAEFEEFGLFFEEGIVKLNKIYSIKEIIEAISETIDLLAE